MMLPSSCVRSTSDSGTDMTGMPFGEYFPEEMSSLGAHFLRLFGYRGNWKPTYSK